MASGLPTIVAQNDGTRDTVVEGVTGFTFPVGGVELLATHIRTLIEHPERRSQMGAAGRRRAEEHFSWNRHMEQMCAMWSECITRKGRSRPA
jgi:glycosyltransferase involved in cell wall biosynthesis